MQRDTQGSKLALVTGAAHRLGKAIALGLANAGFDIGLHYHQSEKPALETLAEIRAIGRQGLPLKADLRNPDEIDRMFATIAESKQHLAVLVNSAAVMSSGSLETMSVELWESTFALNLTAPMICGQKAAQLMLPEGGVIINISDAGAERIWTGYPAYITAKSAINMLTRLQARTYAPAIRVNAVAPGLIMRSPDTTDEKWQKLVQRLPLKKEGMLDDIVKAVLFLVDHDYITGQILAVDGGYQLI